MSGFVNWVCGRELDPHFLAFLFIASRSFIRSLGSGAVHKTVYVPTVEAWHVCVPPIDEQGRLVTTLTERLVALERIRAKLEEQRSAIEVLPLALLRNAFAGQL